MMFASIIVPVYNSEKYLKSCLDSVLSQDFADYELLLVDDCSKDSSVSICKEYDSSYPQVHFIQREVNGGVGAARNTGLEYASGEYVTFLDNDDYWLDVNPLQLLLDFVQKNNKPDVLTFQTLDYWSATGTLEKPNLSEEAKVAFDKCKTRHERNQCLINTRLYCSAVWSKLIRRDFIEGNEVRFPSGRRNEDSYFSLELLYHEPTIALFENPFYVWRRASANSQSAKMPKLSEVKDLFLLVDSYSKLADGQILCSEAAQEAGAFAAYLYVVLLSYLDFFSDEEIGEIRSRCISMAGILKNRGNGRVKLTRMVSRLLGIRMTSHLLGRVMAHEKKRVISR